MGLLSHCSSWNYFQRIGPDPLGETETQFERLVRGVLDGLNEGDVVTYGEVAAEAGHPGAHRAVGWYLSTHSGHPWWRVVTSTGRLVPGMEEDQARQLATEGVPVVAGRVSRT